MSPSEAAPAPVHEIEHLWIALSDGCRLSARLWLPASAASVPVPAILEYIPYRKRDAVRRRDEGMHGYFAAQGYAAVRVDLRGSGESEGILHDEYLLQEQDDALEVIAWIARQPWCSGRVGMMGKSWGAFNALQVAARRPPALAAVIAVMGTDDRFAEDVHYSGGCLLNDNFWWGCIMQVFNARPPDPQIVGADWRHSWLERLEAERFWPALWLEHPARDAYWKHGSVCTRYADIGCPVWFWGGWADIYRDTPLRLAEHLQVPHKVTVGPWAHLYPHEGAPTPAVGFLQEAVRWWDHWLKGSDEALMREPRYRFFMMESVRAAPSHAQRAGRWVGERDWPSPHVRMRTLLLGRGCLQSEAAPEQPLCIASPQSCGLAGGEWGSFAIEGDLPGDQNLDAGGSLQFDSTALDERVEILGNAIATLEIAADEPSAFVAVRLIDVAPDGAATLVARGLLQLSCRDGAEEPVPLVPGQRYRVQVPLTATAYAFPAGHRLRLAVSSAYWPIAWPPPRSVTLTVWTGVSALRLPVRAPQAADLQLPELPPPRAAASTSLTTLRAGRLERSLTINQLSGEVTHRLFIDGGVFGPCGKLRLESIGAELAHVSERVYRIHPDDPTSAQALMRQTYEMREGAWQIRIEAGACMSCTETHFELQGWVEAFEGERLLKRKEWRERIARRHL